MTGTGYRIRERKTLADTATFLCSIPASADTVVSSTGTAVLRSEQFGGQKSLGPPQNSP